MIIEGTLEHKIKDKLRGLNLGNYQFVCGRDVAPIGETLSEHSGTNGVIAIASSFRQHQEFTIPFIDISFSISILTRADQDANASIHEETIYKIGKYLSEVHSIPSMIDDYQTEDFFPGGLNVTSGTGRVLDKGIGCWTETISIMIRGTENY